VERELVKKAYKYVCALMARQVPVEISGNLWDAGSVCHALRVIIVETGHVIEKRHYNDSVRYRVCAERISTFARFFHMYIEKKG
jgi:hypothetical protein